MPLSSKDRSRYFSIPRPGRYFRLRSTVETNFRPLTSAAEIDVFGSSQPVTPPSSADAIATTKGSDGSAWIKINRAGGWTSWYSIGGELLHDPVVVASPGNKWDLFALATDRSLLTQTNTGSGWSGWISLRGVLTARPAAAVSGNGRIDVLAPGTDRGVWTRAWLNGSWSNWTSIGGCTLSTPATIVGGDGLLRAFIRGCDNAVWTSTLGAGGWSGWSALGGTANSEVTGVRTASGRIQIFIIDPSQAPYTLRQTATGAWGTWQKLSGSVIGSYVSPALLPNGDVVLFALGADKKIYSGSFSQATGAWSAWQEVSLYNYWTESLPIFVAPPRVVVDTAGNVLMTAPVATGELWETRTVYGRWILWTSSN